ncbi:MAG: glycosyl transferase [Burkholderiales bacterium]
MLKIYWAPALSFVVSFLLLWWAVSSLRTRMPLDTPNTRSLHSTPVPRVGGVGVLAGSGIGFFVLGFYPSLALLAGALLLACVSLGDDWRGIPVVWRLAAQLCAASFVAWDMFIDYGPVAMVIATLAITWMTNLYNFMDGSDGLAGGMAMFGFSFYAIAAWSAGSSAFGMANASIAAAAAAFLFFNFHPARIFLGDVGSVPLGFLAAAFGITGWLQHDWAWWFPLLVFSPFIVDASITLARRLTSGTRVWEAHRDHYYQRLVRMGFGHRATALAEYALMLACGSAALWAMTLATDAQHVLFILMGLLYATLIAIIERAWRVRHKLNA